MIFKTNIRQIIAFCAACLCQTAWAGAQTHFTPVRTAYSALSAGIGTLWLTHEQGHFKKHGLESNLIYIRGGAIAVQALLAGEIQFGHLSPATARKSALPGSARRAISPCVWRWSSSVWHRRM